MINVNGFWHYKEELNYGEKVGESRLFQDGNALSGSLVFKEILNNGNYMIVRVSISGIISDENITLNDTGYTILTKTSDFDYLPKEREGVLNTQGQIVGSVTDKDVISGVFVMYKLF